MRISRTAVIAITAGAVSLGGMVVATPASATTVQGCPSGAVCIYPQNAGWNGGHPSLIFFSYGYHNLTNQFGTHRFYNHQTGGASAYGCSGSVAPDRCCSAMTPVAGPIRTSHPRTRSC
jgi:hypothetical protein